MTRLALVLMVALTGGCLGIEGTDVSTGAAPSSEGTDGGASVSDTNDPSGITTTDPASTDPSTTSPGDTGDEGPITASDTATDPSGTTDDGESTGGDPSNSTGESAEGADEMGSESSGTDVDTEATGTGGSESSGSESSGSESGSESTGDTCGDGEIQVFEQCDGEDLQGFDCYSLGFESGELSCDPVSCTFDTSACEA